MNQPDTGSSITFDLARNLGRQIDHWNSSDRDVLSWLRECHPDPAVAVESGRLRIDIEPWATALAADTARKGAMRKVFPMMKDGALDRADADATGIAGTYNSVFQSFCRVIHAAIAITAPITKGMFGPSGGKIPAHARILDAVLATGTLAAKLNDGLATISEWRATPAHTRDRGTLATGA